MHSNLDIKNTSKLITPDREVIGYEVSVNSMIVSMISLEASNTYISNFYY